MQMLKRSRMRRPAACRSGREGEWERGREKSLAYVSSFPLSPFPPFSLSHLSSVVAKSAAAVLLALALLAPVLLTGCGQSERAEAVAPREPSVQEIASPAGPGSLTPHLYAGPEGRLYLSWQARLDTARTALRFAVREDGRWSAPRTVAEGADWFVNWADFPSLVALGEGVLAAHALVRSGAAPYAYDVHLFRSDDGGRTWSEGRVPHRDATQTEHGFVSLVPGAEGRLGVVWLDGRRFAEGEREMTLRYAALGPEGALTDETLLDERACDCCQTAAVRTPEGLVVAYRDRSPEEVRDIAVVRRVDGQWTAPQTLHADGWQIAACPVNGPALDAAGDHVAVAWFTMAEDQPRVKIAFSEDAGATFGAPVVVSAGRPLGRVDVVLRPGGTALVSWMETAEDGARLRVRPVSPEGGAGEAFTVAWMRGGRAAGFPQMAALGDSLYLAWTDSGTPSRVRMAVTALP